jgi:pSer/pThr/pTyr-binding forkhead associated (FHA) protein
MSDYLEVVIDVFDETDQRASVRTTLTVGQLLAEVTREFADLDFGDQIAYCLTMQGSSRPLDRDLTLSQQGVQSGDRLVLGWARNALKAPRRPVSVAAVLQESTTQVTFPIEWQPAIIGRPDADQTHNQLLAANLEWLPNGRRVSRRHAQITEGAGVYYIESLTPKNATLLNGERLETGRTYTLQPGDTIELGYSKITLRFMVQGN